MAFKPAKEQLKIILDNIEELLPGEEFAERLLRSEREGRPLRVKQGFDPTAPDIHLGHTVGLRKLRQFQDLGHQVVLIVGDYTALVGDPSGRNSTRPQLEPEVIESNARTYLEQFFKVVDASRTEVRRNSEWFAPMGMIDVIRLCARYTVARMLERDDFSKRWAANQPISVHELLYPIMQGFDSVMIRSDVELGATEQKFNLLVGRALQEDYARGEMPWCEKFIPDAVKTLPVTRPGQNILTLPILVGTDGTQRMSKSTGNYIGVSEPPNIMYEKLMRVPDSCLEDYFRLVTDVPVAERPAVADPREAHKWLGQMVVRMYHGAEAAVHAAGSYGAAAGAEPVDARVVEVSAGEEGETWVGYLAVKAGLAKSTTEARAFLKDGGFSHFDGTAWSKVDPELKVPSKAGSPPFLLRRGKRQETTVRIVWK